MIMSPYRLRAWLLACACLTGANVPVCAKAQGTQETKPVEAPTVPVLAPGAKVAAPGVLEDSAETGYVADATLFDLAGAAGGSNPMRAISLLPGVDSPAIDPFGLANMPGSNKGLRIRGELNMHGNTIGTVEGVPTMGVDPGPGYQFLIDNENLASIAVYQGPIAPGRLAYFTTSGVVDSQLRWPEAMPGAELSQSFGDYGFLRSAARLDSGDIAGSGVRAFASASWAAADKWRGDGKSPSGKTGVAFGLTAEPLNGLETKLFFSYSTMQQDTYRGLTYAQATHLAANRFLDFSDSSSAVASQAILYQGYNKQDFTDWMLLGEISYRVSDTLSVTVKPYYFHEDGAYLDGMPNGKIRHWLIDHDAYGLTAEAAATVLGSDITVGTFWSSLEPPGPPTAWKMYNPDATGGKTFAMWSILGKSTERHSFTSLYATAARDMGGLHVELGARYVWEHVPGITQYNTAGIGDVSYAQALAASSGPVANRSVTGYTNEAFLPYAAIRYALSPNLSAKLSSGRNFGAPGFEAWPVFQANAASFLAKGITADMLWQTIKPETSTVTDFALRWDFAGAMGSGYIEPTVYYANYQHKSVSYDPGIGIAYNSNIGKTHAHGLLVSAHYQPCAWGELFASLAYGQSRFGADLPTLSTASAATAAAVAVKGKDVPDAPQWTGSFGAIVQWGRVTVTPVARYVGARFGDSRNTQQVPDYLLFDIAASYDIATSYGKIAVSLAADNLFDKRYVGFINSAYYQASSASGGIYFPGAPRTVWGKIAFKM